MLFSEAFEFVKKGYSIRLPYWKKDVIVKVKYPNNNDIIYYVDEMTHPYLYVESRYGKVPWNITFVELFSDKWEVFSTYPN